MSGPPHKRRRTRAIGPDSVEFAKAFTHKSITTTNRSGIEIKKDVLVPLIPIKPILDNTAGSSRNDIPSQEYYGNMDGIFHENDEDPNLNHNKSKVGFIVVLYIFINKNNRGRKITSDSLWIESPNY